MNNIISKPHVVIVGAAGGIGYALTKKILSDYKLTLIVRNKDKIEFNEEHILKIITQKAVTPTLEEVKKNPRCRSASLRVAEHI